MPMHSLSWWVKIKENDSDRNETKLKEEKKLY